MGTWGAGPFDNDAVADFLAETSAAPEALAAVLHRCTKASYIDVDDSQPAIAVCELVALAFGYGNLDRAPARIRHLARSLGPNESLRSLAIRALGPLADPKRSEVASLWAHDPEFSARLSNLMGRLVDAGDN
jgi:Domain of unknown function (DUF4259)